MAQIPDLQTEVEPRYRLDKERLQGASNDFLDEETAEMMYRSMPADRVIKVKVTLRAASPGKPMEYPLPDEA